jgi:hypothetical protein
VGLFTAGFMSDSTSWSASEVEGDLVSIGTPTGLVSGPRMESSQVISNGFVQLSNGGRHAARGGS